LIDKFWSIECSVEVVKSAYPNAIHPFKVELNSFLGNIAVHPMPPHARLGRIRRVLKAGE
jgi:hypothetical protein